MVTVQISDNRSGSAFLYEALDSHPEVEGLGLVFYLKYTDPYTTLKGIKGYKAYKDSEGISPEDFFDKILNGFYPINSTNLIIRMIYLHCNGWNLTDFLRKRDIPIIHLIRRNHLKKVISQLHANNPGTDYERVWYNPGTLAKNIGRSMMNLDNYRRAFSSSSKYIEIYQEDMIGEKEEGEETIALEPTYKLHALSNRKTFLSEEANTELCEFLGISNHKMYSHQAKLNTKPLEDLIENMPEVTKVLEQKGLDSYLYED
jgi:hypothetical protein